MKTLIYGAGPIGRWLTLRMEQAGQDVTLLARNETYRSLEEHGIEIVDGLTGERLAARPKLVDRLDPEDRYDSLWLPCRSQTAWPSARSLLRTSI